MKPMSERKMDMKRGEHESFFPDAPHMKVLKRPGEVKNFDYPDTEEHIIRDQESAVKGITGHMPKSEFRH